MTIDAAIDFVSFHTDVVRIGTAVSPPFSRPEKPYDGYLGGYRDMRRAGVAADVDACTLCQFVKALEARLRKHGFSAKAVCPHLVGKLRLFRTGSDYRHQALFPKPVRQLTELFGVPKL